MFLAIREIRHAKARYVLLLVIMLLVTFLVLFVTGLARGLAYANASSVENMPARYLLLQQNSDNRFSRSQLDSSSIRQAQAAIGQEHAASLGVRMGTITVDGGIVKTDIAIFGIDPDGLLAPEAVEGTPLRAAEEGEVLADSRLKEAGVKLGSLIKDQSSGLSWKVGGFTDDASYSHAPVVYINLTDWSKLNGGAAVYNAIAIQGSREAADAAAATLKDVDLITKKEAISAIPGYSAEQASLTMMIAFLFVIAAFVLTVFAYVMTLQKTSQFGVLKAIGVKTGYLAGSVLLQMVLLSVVSVAVGLALTWGMALALPSGMPFMLEPGVMAGTALLMIVVSAAGALVSALRVAKIDALDAIGRVA
ncbi:ABC transporter permease [Paenibacillus yonginensis]|uniref:Putative hemin transport system permease protein HrtB n=1 Tax=Paenibacillus yonginensis TaxID=1462996 RepID=A0A1B1N1T6_9BACL|nr:ABC transporter permease [Paenibacillus yonginensis]ANS75381.1 ABC transporter permease [Paenibacillus yonginensis]